MGTPNKYRIMWLFLNWPWQPLMLIKHPVFGGMILFKFDLMVIEDVDIRHKTEALCRLYYIQSMKE